MPTETSAPDAGPIPAPFACAHAGAGEHDEWGARGGHFAVAASQE